mmetsp:Transcript_30169/g.46186  ORF Transcript_30169/g.46186 Transcript_30169/m.46186 type:complete len:88 (-) Transcript_30169:52-315(-)
MRSKEEEEGSSDRRWWNKVTYVFDVPEGHSEGRALMGQIVLDGWWRVPRVFVTAKLQRDRNGWILGHCWFGGDAQDDICFIGDDCNC